MKRKLTPIQQAAKDADLGVSEIARRARYSEGYVRKAMRAGGPVSYNAAQRLAGIIGCDGNHFLRGRSRRAA